MKIQDLGVWFPSPRKRVQLPMLPAIDSDRIRVRMRSTTNMADPEVQARILERLARAAREIT